MTVPIALPDGAADIGILEHRGVAPVDVIEQFGMTLARPVHEGGGVAAVIDQHFRDDLAPVSQRAQPQPELPVLVSFAHGGAEAAAFQRHLAPEDGGDADMVAEMLTWL